MTRVLEHLQIALHHREVHGPRRRPGSSRWTVSQLSMIGSSSGLAIREDAWRASTDKMTLVERFRRVDEDTLEHEFTVTDLDTCTISAGLPRSFPVGARSVGR